MAVLEAASGSLTLAAQLEAAVHSGDTARVRCLTEGLSEEERIPLRKALEKPTRALLLDLTSNPRFQGDRTDWDAMATYFATRLERQSVIPAARLVLVAVGSKAQAQWALVTLRRRLAVRERFMAHAHEGFVYHAGWVLLDRQTEWALELLPEVFDVEDRFGWDFQSQLVLGKELYETGKLPRDVLLARVSRVARRSGFYGFDLSKDFWRDLLLTSLEARDDPPISGSPFHDSDAVREASLNGRLPREPLIDLTIARLLECSKKVDANWWAQFLEALRLSENEWSERSEAVLDLLGAPTDRAAGIGIELARRLLAAGALAPEALVFAVQPALSSEVVAVARGAVELLRTSARMEPSLLGESLAAALQALSHPKPAVSAAVLNWLEWERGWKEDPVLVQEVALAASAQPEAIVSRIRALVPPEMAPEPPVQSNELDPGEVLRKVRQHLATSPNPEWRAFLDKCAVALEKGTPPPRPPDGAELWRRGEPYSVPGSAEETARLLLKEDRFWSQARNFEAILAGMRLPLTPEEPKLLGRMLQRCLRADASPMPDGWSWPAFWERTELRPSPTTCTGRFLKANLDAWSAGIARRPLQTPTHDNGYLAPEVFADRVAGVGSWGELELLELGSALYRLGPGVAARAKAWKRLDPIVESLPPPVRSALSVALGPEEEVETSGQALFRWAVDTGFDAADPNRVTPLRLLCAAARARFPTSPAPFLRDGIYDAALKPQLTPLNTRLTESLFTYGDGEFECCLPRELRNSCVALWEPSMSESAADMDLGDQIQKRALMVEAQMRLWDSLWLFPELAALHPRPAQCAAVESAFRFPAGARLMLHGYAVVRSRIWDWEALTAAIRAAGDEGGPLGCCLPALQTLASDEHRAVREAAIALVQQAFGDGRLTGEEVVEFLVGGLTSQAARPRSLLSALVPLTDLHPELRLAASVAALTVLSDGGEKTLSGANRTALLEAMHGWLAANGSGVEVAGARIAIEALAGAKAASRSRELARLLLRLPDRDGRPSASQMLAIRDVELALSRFCRTVETL